MRWNIYVLVDILDSTSPEPDISVKPRIRWASHLTGIVSKHVLCEHRLNLTKSLNTTRWLKVGQTWSYLVRTLPASVSAEYCFTRMEESLSRTREYIIYIFVIANMKNCYFECWMWCVCLVINIHTYKILYIHTWIVCMVQNYRSVVFSKLFTPWRLNNINTFTHYSHGVVCKWNCASHGKMVRPVIGIPTQKIYIVVSLPHTVCVCLVSYTLMWNIHLYTGDTYIFLFCAYLMRRATF